MVNETIAFFLLFLSVEARSPLVTQETMDRPLLRRYDPDLYHLDLFDINY